MAISGTYSTYDTKGIREDLSDLIWRITPTVTPFQSAIAKEKATNTFHEWQTQDLASVGVNAQIEGADAGSSSITPTARLGNYTQIMSKVAQVSGTDQSVKSAGRNNEMAYQMSLKALELRRDLEAALCSAANGASGAVSNGTAVAGSTSAARSMRGLEGWIATNLDLGSGGAAPVYTTNPGTAPTDGTARAFTETMLKNVLQQCYTQGGEPDLIMLGASQRQTFSTFTGNSTRFDQAEDRKVVATVDVYVSDFGTLKVTANRFQRNRSAFVLETDKWALATLRGFETQDIAKTGDSDKKQIIVEATLVARQEKASGAVKDLS